MDKHPSLQIAVDSDLLVLKGFGAEAAPTTLSGHLILRLNEPTSFNEIALEFKGRAIVPSVSDDCTADSYELCTRRWVYLKAEGTGHCTLDAGRHVYPFDLCIEGSLPSSISTSASCMASVSYRLHAVATRPGLMHKLQARTPVFVTRLLPSEDLEYQQTLETETTWYGKLMYSVSIPHKAWAAGDTVSVLAKFSPISKHIKITNIHIEIKETVKVWTSVGWHETRHTVASKTHDLRPHPRRHGSLSLRKLASTISLRAARPSHDVVASGNAAHDIVPIDGEISASDVVALLEVPLPTTVTPTHIVEPVKVTHRIHWAISVIDVMGHAYEQRCSLPLHILDHRLLAEAQAATLVTRRLFFGLLATDEERELPSYSSHVRDRVADIQEYEGALVEVRNPWAPLLTAGKHHPFIPNPYGEGLGSPDSSRPSTPSVASRRSSLEISPVPTRDRSNDEHSPTKTKGLRGWLQRSSSLPSRKGSLKNSTAMSSAPGGTHPLSLALLSKVPSYDVASRGYIGGLPPLDSMLGLPSYS
ncbi:hypothetical protein OF83DRAFT_612347 [Amylostereum chailletii]|nr:hypothetical protein OF83DRAFT_612347 [Amylostereum chailletii]